ncbi:MAG TPA: OsmC family protein [Candidatus Methylomirabilis sp.]|nr:OsmC family protein [Candidatus Methylomirabilis sp.]
MSQSGETNHRTTLTREEGYRFRVRFDHEGMPDLITDEAPPIGEGKGPTPSRLLATAVANCLAASLLFCLGKARIEVEGLEAEVVTEFARNEAGRLRIGGMRVRLSPRWDAETAAKAQRCLGIFESFCVVTESVRHGVPVSVEVDGVPPASEGAGGAR